MADDKEQSEKTEEPTQKRIDDARKKGQVYNSREINSFMLLFTFALLIGWNANSVLNNARNNLAQFIHSPDLIPAGSGGLSNAMEAVVTNIAFTMAGPMLAFVAAALFAGFAQKPLAISLDSIKPKWEKVSIPKGVKRLFSLRSVVEFLKGIFKISVVGIVAFMVIWPNKDDLLRLPNTDIEFLLDFLQAIAVKMLTGVLIVLFFIAMVDYFYQRFEYYKNMRMTKQEVKDEYKQQEGDPIIKQRLRQLRMDRARKRMMADVPTSDVVITNPTHYSVALKYDNKVMAAPHIIAKGKNKVAFKIREIAKENDIPIVENPPLARALFTVPLDEQVPLEHFEAVAKVISYVYSMKGKKFKKRKDRDRDGNRDDNQF